MSVPKAEKEVNTNADMSLKDDFTISMGGVDMSSNFHRILDDSSKVTGSHAIAELLRISGHDMLHDE